VVVGQLSEERRHDASRRDGQAERRSRRRADPVRKVLLRHDDEDAERDVERDAHREEEGRREPDVARRGEREKKRNEDEERREDDDAASETVREAAA